MISNVKPRKALIGIFGQVLQTAAGRKRLTTAFGRQVRQLLAEQGGVEALAAQCRNRFRVASAATIFRCSGQFTPEHRSSAVSGLLICWTSSRRHRIAVCWMRNGCREQACAIHAAMNCRTRH